MTIPRGDVRGSRRRALAVWVLAIGALVPCRSWAQDPSSAFLALPLMALEEQGSPVAFDCQAAATDESQSQHLLDPAQTFPAAACAGAPLGFSAAGSGTRFGWFGMLGNFRYLAALPALLAVGGAGGGGGGGGGGGAQGDAEGDGDETPKAREERRPYRSPVPEPASIALFLSGALLVGGAVHRRRR